MVSIGHGGKSLLAVAALLSAGLAGAAQYPPADHGGADVVMASGDVIWGNHTNIGRFLVPAGAVVSVKPYGTGTDTGWVEIHADDIIVSGTLNARGAGLWGGGGGGGGGGALVFGFWGQGLPSHGGGGGAGSGISSNGATGQDGLVAFGSAAAGGNGGAGGRGAGQGAGNGGSAGIARLGAIGGTGSSGQSGGYAAPGANGDTSIHADVLAGSGGGGGGGGAGGAADAPSPQGNTAGGGGGSGAAGANGGGAVKLFASAYLSVSGTIDTRGAGGGGAGAAGFDAYFTPFNTYGGDGGNGAGAAASVGSGAGGPGGHGVAAGETFGAVGHNGGNGGGSSPGGGGGIVLWCLTANGIDLTSATLEARGGANLTTNGGTVKLFFEGTDPTDPSTTIWAGRILRQGVLPARRWEFYQ